MLLRDLSGFTLNTLRANRLHSVLTGLGIAVGIAAVILLTSLGQGLQRYVLAEFTQFGTNLIGINPGRVTTMGTPLGILGSERLLTIEDAEAIKHLPQVQAVVPMVYGNGEVEWQGRRRRITLYGVGPEMDNAFQMHVQMGRFLPKDNPRAARPLVVLGHTTWMELFAGANPLGSRIRIGNIPSRVVGVMEAKGQMLGFDMDDTVYLPAVRALDLFNREGLMEIDVLYREGLEADEVARAIKRILISRHGQEDFTITTQAQMLEVLGSVLGMLTAAVATLGGISLLVGSIGILTIMTIGVRERIGEIGLLRALGATRGRILQIFLLEATVLAVLGGLAGLLVGIGGAGLLHFFIPALPVHTPVRYVLAAELLAAAIGLLSGVLPARRAALLDPVQALRSE
ncbi:MAG TPA: FtsX-like permease family protein [Desulfobulbaceae bacterium]|nr:FtsX-like permease family protein [Desulfobulbaceae bacterium]